MPRKKTTTSSTTTEPKKTTAKATAPAEQKLARVSKENDYNLWKKLVDKTTETNDCKYCQVYKCINDLGDLYYKVIGINDRAEMSETVIKLEGVL